MRHPLLVPKEPKSRVSQAASSTAMRCSVERFIHCIVVRFIHLLTLNCAPAASLGVKSLEVGERWFRFGAPLESEASRRCCRRVGKASVEGHRGTGVIILRGGDILAYFTDSESNIVLALDKDIGVCFSFRRLCGFLLRSFSSM